VVQRSIEPRRKAVTSREKLEAWAFEICQVCGYDWDDVRHAGHNFRSALSEQEAQSAVGDLLAGIIDRATDKGK
jgi:hypothetical protein